VVSKARSQITESATSGKQHKDQAAGRAGSIGRKEQPHVTCREGPPAVSPRTRETPSGSTFLNCDPIPIQIGVTRSDTRSDVLYGFSWASWLSSGWVQESNKKGERRTSPVRIRGLICVCTQRNF
jgi:hypothetical protein